MIWVYVAVLALVSLAPVFLFAWRGAASRGRQASAMALHRAQLAELDRDLAEGRLLPEEHEGARLEVQRRLLADADLADGAARKSGALPVIVVALCVPAAAVGLYTIGGIPEFPPKEVPPPPISKEEAARQAGADPRGVGEMGRGLYAARQGGIFARPFGRRRGGVEDRAGQEF
jgi:cytochrome c-type biogenesis protein CcmH